MIHKKFIFFTFSCKTLFFVYHYFCVSLSPNHEVISKKKDLRLWAGVYLLGPERTCLRHSRVLRYFNFPNSSIGSRVNEMGQNELVGDTAIGEHFNGYVVKFFARKNSKDFD